MPFYQYNGFLSRITESKSLQPLYPLSATPLSKVDPPKVIYDTIHTKPVSTAAPAGSAGMSTSTKYTKSTLDPKRLELYRFYQKNIHEPVFLKRGTPDKILFAFTAIGIGISTLISFSLFNNF